MHPVFRYIQQKNKLKSKHRFLHCTTWTLKSETDELQRWKDRCKADEQIWSWALKDLPQQPEMWILENLKLSKSRNEKKKKNHVRCRIEKITDANAEMYKMTNMYYNVVWPIRNMKETNSLEKSTDEVMKLINYWLKKRNMIQLTDTKKKKKNQTRVSSICY